MLVSVGAALFTMVSAYAWTDWRFSNEEGLVFDPTRIAAQVVTGIGFLGAGAIIRQGLSVKGLTGRDPLGGGGDRHGIRGRLLRGRVRDDCARAAQPLAAADPRVPGSPRGPGRRKAAWRSSSGGHAPSPYSRRWRAPAPTSVRSNSRRRATAAESTCAYGSEAARPPPSSSTPSPSQKQSAPHAGTLEAVLA